MTISDYLTSCQLFPLMGVSQLTDIAELLDTIMKLRNGSKTCGSLITSYNTDATEISTDDQETIAKSVYYLNKNKWDSLLAFVDENIKPWIESQSTKTTDYGKVVTGQNSGTDSYAQTNGIAGFDSTEFSDDSKEDHTTTYGRETTDTNSGTDTEKTESRSTQAERLVDYTMRFWDRYGITRTIIADAVNAISLPMYNYEEE